LDINKKNHFVGSSK